MVATRRVSAMLSFAPHSIGSPVKGSRQLAAEGLTAINYQLLALRCGQRSLVGNGFIRSAVMVLPVPTGRATAINVSAQCKCASKKCVCLTAKIKITPHPSPRRHLPLKGKARAKLRLRAVVLTASVDATSGTDKSVPYRVQAKFCTNIAQLPGVRNDTVSTAASNRDTEINVSVNF